MFIFSRAKSEGPHGGMVNGHSPSAVPTSPTSPGIPEDGLGSGSGQARVKKKSLANMFLPANNEDAVLVLRKVSAQVSRKSSFDSGIGLQEEEGKKKSVSKMATSDKNEQAKLTAELCNRLTYIAEKMAALEKESEDIQQKQRTSNEFQIQVMKKSDAPDLEKGVTKVLDMVQFDRKQELSRLLKKVDDFKRRLARGTKLDGDDDELRDLLIATGDLEKKTMKGFDEITRLQVKTENVVVRQKEVEAVQRKKREAIAMGNSTMRTLISDGKAIDAILSEVRDFQNTEQKEGEKQVQEFFTLMGEDAIEQIREDIEKIEQYKQHTEELKNEVWEDRLENNRIQTAVVDADPEVNVTEAAEALRDKIKKRKDRTKEMKQEYETFLKDQKKRYDVLLKTKREEAEKARLKAIAEEEERKRKEEEEKERLRLLRIQQEEERKRKEEEEKLRKAAEEEARKLKAIELQKKSDAQTILNNTTKNLQKMRFETDKVEKMHAEIDNVREKRRDICLDPSGLKDDAVIDKMHKEFNDFTESLVINEDEVVALGRLLVQPGCDADELLQKSQQLQQRVEKDWEPLEKITKDTDKQLNNQKRLLDAQVLEIKRREEEAEEAARKRQAELDAAAAEAERLRLLAEEQRRLLEEQERLRRLRDDEEAQKWAEEERRRRQMEEEERLRRMREEEEERLRRLREEEEARLRMKELEKMEENIVEMEEEIKEIKEEWRDFDWDEYPWDGEYAGEMIGCVTNPAFLYGIRDPKKIAEILRRAARMKALRDRQRAEAEKMKWICKRIQEMIEEAKIAEEKRLARQNKEWVKDAAVFSPADSICSTHNATFAPVGAITLEESRRQAAERKKSARELAPVTLQELAKHSNYDTDVLEGGYGAWSRKRINEQANAKAKSSSTSTRRTRLI